MKTQISLCFFRKVPWKEIFDTRYFTALVAPRGRVVFRSSQRVTYLEAQILCANINSDLLPHPNIPLLRSLTKSESQKCNRIEDIYGGEFKIFRKKDQMIYKGRTDKSIRLS